MIQFYLILCERYKENILQRFFHRLDQTVSVILVILVVMMVISITTEIVLNALVQPLAGYLLQSPSSWDVVLKNVMKTVSLLSSPVNTLSQTLLVWVGILGSAYALKQREHLGVDALVRLYPTPVRFWLDRLTTLLVAVFSIVVLIVGGFNVAYGAFERGFKMPGIEWLNQGWFYLVLVITGILNLLYCIHHWFYPQPVGSWHSSEQGNSEPGAAES